MPELLIELFSEEIPARMQANAARDLERMAKERLTAAGFSDIPLKTYAGPRRLVLVAQDLPAAQADRTEEVKGPRVGAPPQAMDGFLKKVGLTQADLIERDGVYYAELSTLGRPTAHIIAEMVEHIVRTFPWPKSMKWGTGSLRWVRPLKRIVCLFGGTVIPVDIDGIISGDVSEGHRFMGSGQPFTVRDFATYSRALTDHYVVLEVEDRKRRILDGAKAACEARGFELVEDEGLLDEVAGLAEWPTPILGDMDPSFLDLPPEVIRTSMRTHQKYFAVRDPKTGGLAPHFLVVANLEATDGGAEIAAGNGKVLSARLSDARFFWDEDLKVGFEPWLEKLNGVTFHAKLGTMAERVERIVALAVEIAPMVGADVEKTREAARLSKADLSSGMVGEFPELQGLMGGYYARAAGMDVEIADAIRDHYKPQGPNDTVPTAPVSAAVALADKLEMLGSFWWSDELPTGSRDPYALRRAALGLVRLQIENSFNFDVLFHAFLPIISLEVAKNFAGSAKAREEILVSIVKTRASPTELAAVAEFVDKLSNEVKQKQQVESLLRVSKVWASLRDFILERVQVAFKEKHASDKLKASAVIWEDYARLGAEHVSKYVPDTNIYRINRRVEALSTFLTTDDGSNLLAGYKRAANILRAEEKKGPLPTGAVQPDQPGMTPEETALATQVQAVAEKVEPALTAEDFAGAMTALATLRAPVDAFFEKVLVNSDVPTERENRLKLLGQVKDLMGRVADFSQISG